MTRRDNYPDISWQDIEPCLTNLQSVDGGFSAAIRGLVTLYNGVTVFVKYGSDENTRRWTNKEIKLYRILTEHGFTHIPRLIATNDDETGFALEVYSQGDGWDWQDNWTESRLEMTLHALDELNALPLTDDERRYLEIEDGMTRAEDGWAALEKSVEKQDKLAEMLRSSSDPDALDGVAIAEHARKSSAYVFHNNTFVHYDLRADNCAWNSALGQVRMIDWNWAQIGDSDIELAATMTSVQKSGFDIPDRILRSLNPAALHWIAGFWIHAATRPIWENGPEHLRSLQLASGIVALRLSERAGH